MKFITAEQFLEADRKVKKSIMKWWEPSYGDLVQGIKDTCLEHIDKISTEDDDYIIFTDLDRYFNKAYIVPLLTVGQLIEFVEHKVGEEINIYRTGKGHQIFTEWFDGAGECGFEFETDEKNLLMALWECVQGKLENKFIDSQSH